VTVPEIPGSAAILAASGAGETPVLRGVTWDVFLFKMRIAAIAVLVLDMRCRME